MKRFALAVSVALVAAGIVGITLFATAGPAEVDTVSIDTELVPDAAGRNASDRDPDGASPDVLPFADEDDDQPTTSGELSRSIISPATNPSTSTASTSTVAPTTSTTTPEQTQDPETGTSDDPSDTSDVPAAADPTASTIAPTAASPNTATQTPTTASPAPSAPTTTTTPPPTTTSPTLTTITTAAPTTAPTTLAPTTTTTTAVPIPPSAQDQFETLISNEVFRLTNCARTGSSDWCEPGDGQNWNVTAAERNGLTAYTRSGILDIGAINWTNFLVGQNSIYHSPESGITVAENVVKRELLFQPAAHDMTAANADAIAADFMQLWMDSPGHRPNILSDAYSHFGVGSSVVSTQGSDGLWTIEMLGTQQMNFG